MDYLQPKFYRFSEDSLWLAKQASELCGGEPSSLLDIGCGCGVVGIEAANLIPSIKTLTLLEPQGEFGHCVKSNLKFLRAGVEARFVRSTLEDWNEGGLFDVIVSNPPYFKEGAGRPSSDAKRSKCRAFSSLDHSDFCLMAQRLLSSQGRAYILGHESNRDIHRNGGEIVGRKGKVVLFQFLKSFR